MKFNDKFEYKPKRKCALKCGVQLVAVVSDANVRLNENWLKKLFVRLPSDWSTESRAHTHTPFAISTELSVCLRRVWKPPESHTVCVSILSMFDSGATTLTANATHWPRVKGSISAPSRAHTASQPISTNKQTNQQQKATSKLHTKIVFFSFENVSLFTTRIRKQKTTNEPLSFHCTHSTTPWIAISYQCTSLGMHVHGCKMRARHTSKKIWRRKKLRRESEKRETEREKRKKERSNNDLNL